MRIWWFIEASLPQTACSRPFVLGSNKCLPLTMHTTEKQTELTNFLIPIAWLTVHKNCTKKIVFNHSSHNCYDKNCTFKFSINMCFFFDGTDLLFKKASIAYEPIGSLARVISSSSERVSKLLTNLLGS